MAASNIKGRDITGFVVLMAFVLLAGTLLSESARQGPQIVSVETTPDPSIDNTRASGSAGLYQWTRDLGYRPAEWDSNFLDVPNSASVLFCIAPNLYANEFGGLISTSATGRPRALTADEGKAVRDWVARGHTFILFASSLPWSGSLLASPGADSFAQELGVDIESALGGPRSLTDYAPLEPSVWTDGVDAIRVHPGASVYRRSPNTQVLFGSVLTFHSRSSTRYQSVPIAIEYAIGRGHVVAVSDDMFGCNANLGRDQNALFLRRVLSLCAKPGAAVLFDEYHRGLAAGSASLWSALGRPAQFAILQALIAIIVGMLVLIPRFGRVEPLPDRSPHSSAEYVTSLAALYRNARASGAALDTVYRQFLREICQRYGLPAGTTLDKLAEIASRRGGIDGARLRQLLVACERALESKRAPQDRDVMSLVRAIERFRKDLGIV